MAKNYGPAVSGYLEPKGRNWELVVHQAGKPLLDKELNLASELKEQQQTTGWITKDPIETSEAFPVFAGCPDALIVSFSNMTAKVNGWMLHVGAPTYNKVSLPSSPAVGRRTDLVFLEVWRKLIAPAPNADGKSPSGRIWREGNVRLFDVGDPLVDLNNNYIDDLFDVNVNKETSKRVQIQYRLRVVSSVDVQMYPQGMSDPSVTARTVPTSANDPEGLVTAFHYVPSSDDPTLWIAGDGNPLNTLGTVDGYMYAIPLCAIFRRNRAPFDKNLNHNGGTSFLSGASDRPDNKFHDYFDVEDFLDLRTCVADWDLQEVLSKNVHLLLDNTLRTEVGVSPRGGGVLGHTVLWADEVGLSNANGGDGVTTGDTPGGELIGEFDSVRRSFSDRPVFEVMTVKVTHPTNWVAGEQVSLNPSAIEIYPYAPSNWAAFAPSEVTFTDVLRVRFAGYDNTHNCGQAEIQSITGLGARPQGPVVLTLGAIPAYVTNQDMFVDILVAYPPGRGLSKTAVKSYDLSINNPAQLPSSAPIRYESAILNVDSAHREARLEYRTQVFSTLLSANVENLGIPSGIVYLPERVNSIVSVLVDGWLTPTYTLSDDGHFLNVNPALSNNQTILITYTALRPVPQCGVQMTIWYDARMPQTRQDLPNSFDSVPRAVGTLHTITVGSGSHGESYPYPYGYVQSGAVKTSSYVGDHELDSGVHISLADFDADTGWLQVPTYVGMVANANEFRFLRPGGAAEVDAEGRTYYSLAVGPYLPNAYGQDLTDAKKHKVFLPVLVEQGGSLLLMLLTRWAAFDKTNGVWFDANAATNTTCASIFTPKGRLVRSS